MDTSLRWTIWIAILYVACHILLETQAQYHVDCPRDRCGDVNRPRAICASGLCLISHYDRCPEEPCTEGVIQVREGPSGCRNIFTTNSSSGLSTSSGPTCANGTCKERGAQCRSCDYGRCYIDKVDGCVAFLKHCPEDPCPTVFPFRCGKTSCWRTIYQCNGRKECAFGQDEHINCVYSTYPTYPELDKPSFLGLIIGSVGMIVLLCIVLVFCWRKTCCRPRSEGHQQNISNTADDRTILPSDSSIGSPLSSPPPSFQDAIDQPDPSHNNSFHNLLHTSVNSPSNSPSLITPLSYQEAMGLPKPFQDLSLNDFLPVSDDLPSNSSPDLPSQSDLPSDSPSLSDLPSNSPPDLPSQSDLPSDSPSLDALPSYTEAMSLPNIITRF